MKRYRSILILPLLVSLVSGSGCATQALWTPGRLDSFNQSAANPTPQLFRSEQKNDFLVVYTESSERTDTSRTRADWLIENSERVKRGHRPHFVQPSLSESLIAMPVLTTTTSAEAVPPSGWYAVATAYGQVQIHTGAGLDQKFDLATYNDGTGQIKRIVLTPAAFIADSTFIGSILFLLVTRGSH